MTPQRAKAVHRVDEAWTEVIDHVREDFGMASSQLQMLCRWKKDPPPRPSLQTMRRLTWLAWLALSEAALRATEEDLGGEERQPCKV